MREVQLKWNPETVERSEIGLITNVASMYEVVAHLEVTKIGVRQLVKIQFNEEMGPEQLDQIDFLKVEGAMNPHPLPSEGEEGYIVVWNNHPLSVAAINFDSLHVIPPYVIGKNGVQITIRGLPEGVSGHKEINAAVENIAAKKSAVASTLPHRAPGKMRRATAQPMSATGPPYLFY